MDRGLSLSRWRRLDHEVDKRAELFAVQQGLQERTLNIPVGWKTNLSNGDWLSLVPVIFLPQEKLFYSQSMDSIRNLRCEGRDVRGVKRGHLAKQQTRGAR